MIGQPRVSAATERPATRGVASVVTSRKVGTNETTPIIVVPTTADTSELVTTMRLRKTHGGSTGSSATRSANQKATSSAKPPPKAAAVCQDAHGQACPPSRTPSTSSTSATVSSIEPA